MYYILALLGWIEHPTALCYHFFFCIHHLRQYWPLPVSEEQRNPGPAQTDGQIVGKPDLEDFSKVYSNYKIQWKSQTIENTDTCILGKIKIDMFTFSMFLSKLP